MVDSISFGNNGDYSKKGVNNSSGNEQKQNQVAKQFISFKKNDGVSAKAGYTLPESPTFTNGELQQIADKLRSGNVTATPNKLEGTSGEDPQKIILDVINGNSSLDPENIIASPHRIKPINDADIKKILLDALNGKTKPTSMNPANITVTPNKIEGTSGEDPQKIILDVINGNSSLDPDSIIASPHIIKTINDADLKKILLDVLNGKVKPSPMSPEMKELIDKIKNSIKPDKPSIGMMPAMIDVDPAKLQSPDEIVNMFLDGKLEGNLPKMDKLYSDSDMEKMGYILVANEKHPGGARFYENPTTGDKVAIRTENNTVVRTVGNVEITRICEPDLLAGGYNIAIVNGNERQVLLSTK